MPRNSLETTNLFQSFSGVKTSLHQRVSLDLVKNFKYCALGDSGADATIRQGPKLAVVEVKTGDPDLPLPSSTSAQMRLLTREAKRTFGVDGVEILPVLVTNYRISDADRSELETYDIRVVTIPSASSYKTEDFFKAFVAAVGLEPDRSSSESSLPAIL